MTDTQAIAASELRAFVERIERMESEKADITKDINEIYSEAAGRGYDKKAMKAIIKLRKKDRDERMEEQAILDTYKNALGLE